MALAQNWIEKYQTFGDIIKLDYPPNVQVDAEDSGKLFATVKCVLCQKDLRIGFKKGWRQMSTKDGVKCIFSKTNFDKHMNKHHKLYV